MGKIVIAIDGPAGAGKSTIAKMLAKALNITYIDTGAMYRAVALKAIRNGIPTRDRTRLAQLVSDIRIYIEHMGDEQVIFLDDENVNSLIRTPEVSMGASEVATIPEVRMKLVEIQRKIASENSVVMDGRDIGTYVLPDADCKLFLTASVEERAMRRYKEQLEKGAQGLSYDDVKSDMERRDANDTGRDFAPLSIARDAVIVDSTGLTVQQSVEKIREIIEPVLSLRRAAAGR